MDRNKFVIIFRIETFWELRGPAPYHHANPPLILSPFSAMAFLLPQHQPWGTMKFQSVSGSSIVAYSQLNGLALSMFMSGHFIPLRVQIVIKELIPVLISSPTTYILFSGPKLPLLKNRNNNDIYLTRLWGLNEIVSVQCFGWCSAHATNAAFPNTVPLIMQKQHRGVIRRWECPSCVPIWWTGGWNLSGVHLHATLRDHLGNNSS